MGRRRNRGRDVDGLLLLDKPIGLSSNSVLQRVKRLFQANKAGHTGNLDPLATGLLPICLGEATKVSGFLLDADKRYRAVCRLGEKTNTADSEGEVIETRPVPALKNKALKAVLQKFVGEIAQLPPMYSALKYQGQPLYRLARQGLTVERQPRNIVIYSIEMLGFEGNELTLDVHCSKGTYIRTLAEDIGEELGCGAHIVALRRTVAQPFDDSALITLPELEEISQQGPAVLDNLLLPIDSALPGWPRVTLNPEMAGYIKHGQAVMVPNAPTEGLLKLYSREAEGEQFFCCWPSTG